MKRFIRRKLEQVEKVYKKKVEKVEKVEKVYKKVEIFSLVSEIYTGH